MRLARYLALCGVSSRRMAEVIVAAGRVTVAGEVVTDPARDVDSSTGVAVDGRPIAPEQTVVYAVNKPRGVVSTARDTHRRPTVTGLVPDGRRLYPVGRLDADTTGLILLTNDGELANRLTHPRYGVAKVYRATVECPPVADAALAALRRGVSLDDGTARARAARRLAPDTIELTLTEGRKRQVRRMCEAIGHPVRRLERVAFGPLRLGSLLPGGHRRLSERELERLRRAGRVEAAQRARS